MNIKYIHGSTPYPFNEFECFQLHSPCVLLSNHKIEDHYRISSFQRGIFSQKMQMKIVVTSFTAQYLSFKWEVVLKMNYINFHISYLGSIFKCINFQFRLLSVWKSEYLLCILSHVLASFFQLHTETLENFCFRISYTLLINKTDMCLLLSLIKLFLL